QDRITRAAQHINAVDLGDGDFAYYADETSSYWVVDEDDLADLCDYLDDADEDIRRDAYSHWCAGTVSREMPQGWKPDVTESQYRVEYILGGDCCAACCGIVEGLAADHSIVTADQRREIDAAVGRCEHHCSASQSHRYYDSRGREEAAQ